MTELLKDFNPGPLDAYRKKASFDWKKLKVFLDTEEIIKYQNDLYEVLQNHPEFSINNNVSLPFDEQRRISSRQAIARENIKLLSDEIIFEDFKRAPYSARIMMQLSTAGSIKNSVAYKLFSSSIQNMGTERHQKFVDGVEERKIVGCYCLTEIGHGSNARGMRTTATYNKQKKVFVLHSPDFQAAKCWAGGLGQLATHATVYAQLIIDGVRHGLHAFVVPIRNPKTLIPYEGLRVGDMGEKIGLNGIDNGFLMFDNYEIPRENLLNKVGDVTEDGRYVTPYKDPNKRHGAALGSLSAGRIAIGCICETLGVKALTIAVRYAAVRKQFGPNDGEEVAILEYQSHQHRLLPYLAAAYVLRNANTFLAVNFYEFMVSTMGGDKNAPERGMEIHGISSASKPMAGWIMKDAIQECRETCGGHGYLKAAGIGDIRNDHDANLTYEGENHVLIQQTANYLLKLWPSILQRQKICAPLQSIDFLTNGLDILANSKFTSKSIEEISSPKRIIDAYQWLVTYLLKATFEKLKSEQSKGKDVFWAKNDSQVFYAKTLGIVYIQHFFLQRMLVTISQADDESIRNVLTRVFSLYGLWSLEKHIAIMYKGEYITGSQAPGIIQDAILKLCSDLKDDAVSLIDVIAPADFVLQSALGASDGQVYKHLEESIMSSEYNLKRPAWYQEMLKFNAKSKL